MDDIRTYPVFLRLDGRLCAVIGGGAVAERKIASLLAAGARVRAVSPSFTDGIGRLADEFPALTLIARHFEPADISGAVLVISATDDGATNGFVKRCADEARVPVNVVDMPELCGFFVPASFSRGDLTVAIGTNGRCPAFAKALKEELARLVDERYAELLETLSKERERLKSEYPNDSAERQKRLCEMIDSGLNDVSSPCRRGSS